MSLHPVAKRLAVREYIPFGSLFLTWLLIGFSIGDADLVRLIGANAAVQGARAMCTLEAMQVLARRSTAAKAVWKQSRAVALKIDLAGLAASAVFIAAFVALVAFRDMPVAAGMVAIVAFGIVARHPFGLLVATRKRDVSWRFGVAAAAVTGATIVFALGLPWQAAALVIALRDWGGLIATALFAGPRDPGKDSRNEPLTFAEAAAKTEATARRQLSYRLVKSLFLVILGPVGNVAARTGRGAGRMDSKLSRLVPRKRASMIAFTSGCAIAALVLIFASREPLAFLAAAALTRLSASGGSALLWWKYRGVSKEEDEDFDE